VFAKWLLQNSFQQLIIIQRKQEVEAATIQAQPLCKHHTLKIKGKLFKLVEQMQDQNSNATCTMLNKITERTSE
jgi:hypothetical protein